MNTWGAQAAHATLIPSIGPTSALGAISLDSFALCASLMLLALIVMKSPREARLRWRLNPRWRPWDLWQRAVALASARRMPRSRLRERIDLLLVQMLGDDLDEQPVSARDNEDESWLAAPPASATEHNPDNRRIATNGQVPGSYQSRHRHSEPQAESDSPKPAPRHAAPPRDSLSPPSWRA